MVDMTLAEAEQQRSPYQASYEDAPALVLAP
jgi:hypothetical protein